MTDRHSWIHLAFFTFILTALCVAEPQARQMRVLAKTADKHSASNRSHASPVKSSPKDMRSALSSSQRSVDNSIVETSVKLVTGNAQRLHGSARSSGQSRCGGPSNQ